MQNLFNPSDQELIHAFANKNVAAFEMLVLRHKDKLFTSILFLVKDRYLAEDIFQELWIKIIDTLKEKKYNEEGKFLPWAMRIAHNLCVDHFRKIKNKATIKTADGYDIFELLNFCEDSTEVKMMQQETNRTLHQLLEQLPQDQLEVIVLKHYGDLSFKEIAERTNCSINTALGRMRYGLMNLRKMIAEKNIAI